MVGVRVLDMSAVISGPFATSILADQGAEVIKIESAAAPDITRNLGPRHARHRRMAAMYITANRGKRAICLDLRKPEGVAVVKRLVAGCDVCVQNFRPGVAERLGVDYASLRACQPELIMLSISGYGPSGPYVKAPVYDQVIQAMAGVGTVMKDADGAPGMFHNLLVDKVTALNAAQAVTAALLAKAHGRAPCGQHVQLSMLDSALHFLFPDAFWNKVWADQADDGSEWHQHAPGMELRAADGKVAVSMGNWRQVEGILRVAGLEAQAARVAGGESAAKVMDEAREQMHAALRSMTRQQIFDAALQQGVPCGKFLSTSEVLADPQVGHARSVQEHRHPHCGRYLSAAPPARFSATPSAVVSHAPMLGEDTTAVLLEFGYTQAQVDAMRRDGLFGRTTTTQK